MAWLRRSYFKVTTEETVRFLFESRLLVATASLSGQQLFYTCLSKIDFEAFKGEKSDLVFLLGHFGFLVGRVT